MISDVKILIVDDGTLSSLRVLTGLKNSGFDYIELAVNAKCMFDYLDRGHFAIIISNWSRLEMSGTEFIELVKKNPVSKDIPLIMLVNPSDPLKPKVPPGEEDVCLFSKPIDFKNLGNAIRDVLEKKEISHRI